MAGARYQAGGLHRFLFGNAYRDLWTTPMRVPVLNLKTFAGGLRPLKTAGGNQTKSLRFVAAGGTEYVFRSAIKSSVALPPAYKGTVVETVALDQGSAANPAAALVTAPLLAAAGVLHPTPRFVVMPDDPALGEFRAEFAGRLGMIEEFPSVPKHGPGFAGAVAIINSDELLPLLDRDASQRVDTRALLAARLMDMLFNDWDRHSGQWKWAQMDSSPPSAWLPIARDRDKAFISYGGTIPGMARLAAPNLMSFDSTYPSVQGLTWNSVEFDRRLLVGLDKPAWDSVAAALVRRITDSVIDGAVQALPPEYRSYAPPLARTLKQRRDGLPGMSDRFYLFLAVVADIHATDAADNLTVTRLDDRFVDVQLASSEGTPYFFRRFDAQETREIRIYLHGGDDSAVVIGNVQRSIPVRVIGGNGTNSLVDSSLVGGSHGRTRLYDTGMVSGVNYGPDTLFDRRPWVKEQGEFVPPGPDRGSRTHPIVGLGYGDLGVTFAAGVSRDRFGFRRRPYASQVGFEAEYAAGVDGFRVGISTDHRWESSSVHLTTFARMSMLEVTNFFGLGNDTPGPPGEFFEVRQWQWLLQPAVVFGYAPRSEVSIGPVLQYVTTDSTPDRFISASQPYGVGGFGQLGVQLHLSHDLRDRARNPRAGVMAQLDGSFFPAIWDVTSAFGRVAAGFTAFQALPIPTHPILALRGGAEKVFGAYPYSEAAFVGGMSSVRTLVPQRYGGDASLAGTAELRLPLVSFPLVFPLDVGLFGFVDTGRVYVDGDSPGGWHTAAGGGFWAGILDPSSAISVAWTTGAGQTGLLVRLGLAF